MDWGQRRRRKKGKKEIKKDRKKDRIGNEIKEQSFSRTNFLSGYSLNQPDST
jgi:hypothetical protein